MQANTIDEVIDFLTQIINENKEQQNTLGYFAALYLKVTKKVKEGIQNHFFENGKRMERLDVIFANRYLAAYTQYKAQEKASQCWEVAFQAHDRYWLIVLQHLLLGMNAHINLDLGIAAATVSEGKPIQDLHSDFNKINTILADLIGEVESELSQIWPTLKKILKYTQKLDTFLINFSMEIARDGAWDFAVKLSENNSTDWLQLIGEKDAKVANYANTILSPGFLIGLIFKIIRLGERGTVRRKIEILEEN
ncbi:MAG: DUF5995 family protein [Bacteroidota bacterium]